MDREMPLEAPDETEVPQERLERVEAALRLLLEHMQTSTRGSEILEDEHSHSLLASIAFGFSAIALIAMWTIDLASEDVDIDILRITIGMALILFASTVYLLAASLLRKAVNRAILEKDPSRLDICQSPWHHLFKKDYWATIKQSSSDFYNYQIARCVALVIYIIAGIFLIWAVVTI